MTYEIWRPVSGFPGYEVSDQGRVKSLARRNLQGAMRRARILKTDVIQGYHLVRPALGGVKHPRLVHRLVLTAFKGERPEGCETRHLDGIRGNNSIGNLEWGTTEENRADQKRHGTGIQGNRNPKAKFNEVDVERVHDLRRAGLSQQAIGDHLGMYQTWVSKILKGKHWSRLAA
jgi:hypothetical protein